ncbi:ribonuclease HI family protein [Mesoaciditoga lauensis]|uniref:ribonuclease HI family protein n=1 Tax=Mesoaciditoga lauensis TaxID=1495039 RepID=UPI000564ED54|nr:ribonuclease HI family protein [Mesoaciditoga lauensis]
MKKVIIKTDGGALKNPGRAVSAFVIECNDELVCIHSEYIGETTNNVAEYKAVIMSLKYVKERYKNAKFVLQSDSQLVVRQLSGDYKVKAKNLFPLWQEAKDLVEKLKVEVRWVPREENKVADFLVGIIRRGKSGQDL